MLSIKKAMVAALAITGASAAQGKSKNPLNGVVIALNDVTPSKHYLDIIMAPQVKENESHSTTPVERPSSTKQEKKQDEGPKQEESKQDYGFLQGVAIGGVGSLVGSLVGLCIEYITREQTPDINEPPVVRRERINALARTLGEGRQSRSEINKLQEKLNKLQEELDESRKDSAILASKNTQIEAEYEGLRIKYLGLEAINDVLKLENDKKKFKA